MLHLSLRDWAPVAALHREMYASCLLDHYLRHTKEPRDNVYNSDGTGLCWRVACSSVHCLAFEVLEHFGICDEAEFAQQDLKLSSPSGSSGRLTSDLPRLSVSNFLHGDPARQPNPACLFNQAQSYIQYDHYPSLRLPKNNFPEPPE